MQVLRRPGERPPQRFNNAPPPTPAQYRPLLAQATTTPITSQPPRPPSPTSTFPPRSLATDPLTKLSLDSIRPLFVHGRYTSALSHYQQLRLTLLSQRNHRSVEWLVETARVWRMIGECQQRLELWQDSSLSLTSALSLVDSAVDLPQLPRQWRYDVLILQQQLHHLLGDTHLAQSEAMADNDTPAAIERALEAVQYGRKAEVEARELLDGVADDEDDMEVKEALMGAAINIARAYTHLMTLTRLTPPTPTPSPASTDYFRLAKRKLESSYRAAVTFALHQYQFLAYYNMAALQLADGNALEALHYHSVLLGEVFRKCREDGVSRVLEWGEAEWRAEELSVWVDGGKLVRRLVEEGEVGEVEAAEWLRIGFQWLNSARLAVKSASSGSGSSGGGGMVVDVAQKNEIAVLFNWMKAELARREGSKAAVKVLRDGSNQANQTTSTTPTSQEYPEQAKRRKLTSK